MVSIRTALVSLALALPAHAAATLKPSKVCAADNCFAAASLPPKFSPIASIFCEDLIHVYPGVTTKTATVTATSTLTPARSTVTATATDTTTLTTTPTACSTTVTTSLTTEVFYPTRGASAAVAPRNNVPIIPPELTAGCSEGSILSKVSSACSCFLKPTTSTATHTATVTVTASALQPSTTTTTFHSSATVTVCTQYSTHYVYTGPVSCGIASPTVAPASGQLTCTSPAPAGSTDGRFRIEGGTEGTIFEDCISSGPANVTTPSGGTHECDGTNDNANPNPGATCTTQLQQAAELDSFPFDGTYDASFQDFFITSISQTTQTATQFWGLLQDLAFTPVGGCQQEIAPGGTQETLWAFDAFNANAFLSVAPEYMVVARGTKTVQITVSGSGGDGGTSPFAGASVQGSGEGVSNAQGIITIDVPAAPGCYQYKATASGAIRSNAFYLTVLASS